MIAGLDDGREELTNHRPIPIIDRDLNHVGEAEGRIGRRERVFVALLASALLIASFALIIPPSGVGSPTTWTFMVYLDADNNLERYGIEDFLEMSATGSTMDVNILVEFDRIPGYNDSYGDWTSTKRFRVTQGMTPTAANATQDIGEANMGEPQTLIDFVKWAVGSYPATNYVLILWDHGAGWGGICWDDSNTYDYLDMVELDIALYETGVVYDVIGFDACSMGSIEVAYQVAPYAYYMIGSEIRVPDAGLEYSGPLAELVANTEMSELSFCKEVLNYTAEYYESQVGTPGWSMLNESYAFSVIDLDAASTLVSSASSMSTELIQGMSLWVNHVTVAREQTEQYEGVWTEDVVDLHHLAENLWSLIPNETIGILAANIISDVKSAVLYEVHGTNPDNPGTIIDHVNGITIYFPLEWYDYDYSFGSLYFAYDSTWDEFLSDYYNVKGSGNPTVMWSSPEGTGVPTNAAIEIWFSEEMDFDSLVGAFAITPYVDGSLSWDSVEHKLTFTPTTGLAPLTTYNVTIGTGAMDLEGNHLQIAYKMQFTTGEVIPEFQTVLIPAACVIALFTVIRSRRKPK
ncbi:MAG TPA: clostripain-related cysteine peptidase [Thermoplasmata archaeon]